MGNFTVTMSTLDNQYSYHNESVLLEGNYFVNAQTSTFIGVSGTAYSTDTEGNQGDFIGSFNGSLVEGEMVYSFSQMTKEQYDLVWVAVKELEPYVLGTDNNIND